MPQINKTQNKTNHQHCNGFKEPLSIYIYIYTHLFNCGYWLCFVLFVRPLTYLCLLHVLYNNISNISCCFVLLSRFSSVSYFIAMAYIWIVVLPFFGFLYFVKCFVVLLLCSLMLYVIYSTSTRPSPNK